jgi:hypothetical protein
MTEPINPDASGFDHPVSALLSTLHLAPRQAHKALTLWPLLRESGAPQPPAARCLPLVEALECGSAFLDEVSDGGSVPHARLENRGERPVLVVSGEEILVARQSHIAKASFLVAAGACVVLDGSRVDRGRWARAASTGFRAGRRGASADLSVLESFHTVEEQVGFVAAIGDEIVGLEVVASPALLRALFGRLVRAHAIDALDSAFVEDPIDEKERAAVERARCFQEPEGFLGALARAGFRRAPSAGIGNDLRLSGPGVAGCALEAGGIAHLTAFAD